MEKIGFLDNPKMNYLIIPSFCSYLFKLHFNCQHNRCRWSSLDGNHGFSNRHFIDRHRLRHVQFMTEPFRKIEIAESHHTEWHRDFNSNTTEIIIKEKKTHSRKPLWQCDICQRNAFIKHRKFKGMWNKCYVFVSLGLDTMCHRETHTQQASEQRKTSKIQEP